MATLKIQVPCSQCDIARLPPAEFGARLRIVVVFTAFKSAGSQGVTSARDKYLGRK